MGKPQPASDSHGSAGSPSPGAALGASLTERDERLLERAVQGAKRDRKKRVDSLAEQWRDASVKDILDHLSKSGVRVQPDRFTKLAEKSKSYAKLAQGWKLNKRADDDEVTALTKLLWDKLCPEIFRYDELVQAVEQGYARLENDHNEAVAKTWLPWWSVIRDYAAKHRLTSTGALDKDFNQTEISLSRDNFLADGSGGVAVADSDGSRGDDSMTNLMTDWLLDVDMVLGHEAVQSDSWAEQRLDYVRDVYRTLPDSDSEFLFQIKQAECETLFLLKRLDEGDTCYEQLIETFPHNAWSYIGWADEYSPAFWRDRGIVDISKARSIYHQGLEKVTEERDAIEDRLRMLDEEQG